MSFPSLKIGLAQVCLAGVLWGTGGLAVQVIRETDPLHPMTISAWRLAVAAVALIGGAIALRSAGAVVGLLRRSPGRVVVVALGTAAYQFLYFAAVTHAGVTVATVGSVLVLAAVAGLSRAGSTQRSDPQPPGREHRCRNLSVPGDQGRCMLPVSCADGGFD